MAEPGWNPSQPGFRAQVHNHYTTLPLAKLQADGESVREEQSRQGAQSLPVHPRGVADFPQQGT